jgi:PAS domain S-box-containing protein
LAGPAPNLRLKRGRRLRGRDRIKDRSTDAADEKYRLFAEATEEGIVIHDLVRVLAVNSHLGKMFGYAEEDIVGADPFKLLLTGERLATEPILHDENEIINEALAVRADGGIFPVALRGRAISYQGQPARIVRIRDLTRRRQVEATLSASEERFRATFEQAATGIAHVAIDGSFLRVNQRLCDLLGYARDELLALTFQQLTHPDDLNADLDALNQVLARRRENYAMEKRYLRRDGSTVWANLTVSLVRDAEGDAAYFISIVEDIDDRKVMEESLRQAEKMETVGQLTSSIAHDFGNYLNAIKGNLQLLEPYQIGRRPAEFLKSALAGTELAEKLIRQLLSFSRRQEPEFEPLDINALIRDIEDLLRRAAGDAVEFVVTLNMLECLTICDRSQLESALFNLVANARDALPGGKGEISVATAIVSRLDEKTAESQAVARDYAEIAVKDNGHGMPPDIVARATEPFFTTKDVGAGTGLGLSQVARTLTQAGGAIRIESSEGIGTTIRLFLPMHRK